MDLHEYYSSYLRGSLFSGFLTLTGFLFSVMTFIVINLNKELYASPYYLKKIKELRKYRKDIPIYASLKRVSKFFVISVFLSLITAISHLTIGLINSNWAAIVCLALSGLSIILLLLVINVIRENINALFVYLEAKAEEDLQALSTDKEEATNKEVPAAGPAEPKEHP